MKSTTQTIHASVDIGRCLSHCDVPIIISTGEQNVWLLEEVFIQIQKCNANLKRASEFLGLKVVASGLQPVGENVRVIVKAKKCESTVELQCTPTAWYSTMVDVGQISPQHWGKTRNEIGAKGNEQDMLETHVGNCEGREVGVVYMGVNKTFEEILHGRLIQNVGHVGPKVCCQSELIIGFVIGDRG